MPPKKTPSLKDEPVAKNLRDTYIVLSDLKQFIEKKYGTHNDWASTFIEHKESIVSLPKFKKITSMIEEMTPEYIKGRMKYASGDYAKSQEPPPPPPPPPPHDALDEYYLDAPKGVVGLNKTDKDRLEMAKEKKAELKKAGISQEEYIANRKEENARIAREAIARSDKHDGYPTRDRFGNVVSRTQPITSKGMVHPTTGGGRR
jgi:hypothetical protein